MASDQILALMALMTEIEGPSNAYRHAVRRAAETLTDSEENLAVIDRGNAALLDIEQSLRRWVAKHPEAETSPRCVCGDPIQLMDDADPSSWIHSPGSDTRCTDARPVTADTAAVLRIVLAYVIESNDSGGIDCNDLVSRLESAGYPLPNDEDGA